MPHERQRPGLWHACHSELQSHLLLSAFFALLTIWLWQNEQMVARCLQFRVFRVYSMRQCAGGRSAAVAGALGAAGAAVPGSPRGHAAAARAR